MNEKFSHCGEVLWSPPRLTAITTPTPSSILENFKKEPKFQRLKNSFSFREIFRQYRGKYKNVIAFVIIRLYVCGWCVLTHSMNQVHIRGKNAAVYSRFHRTLKTQSVNWHYGIHQLQNGLKYNFLHNRHAIPVSTFLPTFQKFIHYASLKFCPNL